MRGPRSEPIGSRNLMPLIFAIAFIADVAS
jgi:hypothetical protein